MRRLPKLPRHVDSPTKLLKPPCAQLVLSAPRQQVVIGYEHAHASSRVDRGAVPPAGFGGLDDASCTKTSFIRMILKGHNRNLPVMRANPRTLAARKCGRSSRRVDDDRDRNLTGPAIK